MIQGSRCTWTMCSKMTIAAHRTVLSFANVEYNPTPGNGLPTPSSLSEIEVGEDHENNDVNKVSAMFLVAYCRFMYEREWVVPGIGLLHTRFNADS